MKCLCVWKEPRLTLGAVVHPTDVHQHSASKCDGTLGGATTVIDGKTDIAKGSTKHFHTKQFRPVDYE